MHNETRLHFIYVHQITGGLPCTVLSTVDEPRAMTPRRIAAAQAKLDADRTALNATKDLVEGERDKMAKELEEREDDLRKAQ